MDQNTSSQIQSLVSQHQAIGVVVGQNPSIDSMGAALALYLALSSAGKQVSIACPSDPLVEVSSLVGIDKVTKQLSADGNTLVVSFPYYGNNIDKGSYTVENGYLNIIVKAGKDGLSFDDKDVKYRREGGGTPSLLFVIGTARVSDLGSLFDPESMKDTVIINIDNKKENQGFGEVVLVSSEFSSVSEQVTQLIRALSLSVDADIAQSLLDGIMNATSNFQNSSVSYQAFDAASFLIKKGAVRKLQNKPANQSRKDPFGFDDFDEVKSQSFPQRAKTQRPFNQNQFPQPQRPVMQQATQEVQRPVANNPRNDREENGVPQQQSHQQQQSQPQFPQKKQPMASSDDTTPSDWLTPKIYKGSTNI